jgi:hypothetical protein
MFLADASRILGGFLLRSFFLYITYSCVFSDYYIRYQYSYKPFGTITMDRWAAWRLFRFRACSIAQEVIDQERAREVLVLCDRPREKDDREIDNVIDIAKC